MNPMRMTYEQARADHEYLWDIAPAKDMTGGYVDQEDFRKLLRSPSKVTARNIYIHQIEYWFYRGPDISSGRGRVPWDDPMVREIAERHGIDPE